MRLITDAALATSIRSCDLRTAIAPKPAQLGEREREREMSTVKRISQGTRDQKPAYYSPPTAGAFHKSLSNLMTTVKLGLDRWNPQLPFLVWKQKQLVSLCHLKL